MTTLIGRVISASLTAARRAAVKATLLGRPDEVPHIQPYGLQSHPLAGAEAVVISVGETGDDLVAIVVGDRRYTLALAAGEVALADDLGQRVHMTRTGIVVEANAIKLGAAASKLVAVAGDGVDATAGWAAWFASVSAATLVPLPETLTPLGTVQASTTKTRAE